VCLYRPNKLFYLGKILMDFDKLVIMSKNTYNENQFFTMLKHVFLFFNA